MDLNSASKKDRKQKKRSDKKKERRSRSRRKDEQAPTEIQTKEVTKGKKRSRSENKETKSAKKPRLESATNLVRSFLSNDEKAISTFRDNNRISVHGDVTNFAPLTSFKDADFPPDIAKCTAKFTKPTPIQAQTWPILLSSRDVIGIAETGSGKTLAFGLPALSHIKECKKTATANSKPFALVVAPTRELAQQSHDVLVEVGKGCNPKISSVVVYGGVPKEGQRNAFLSSNADIVVACPGRLLDLINEGCCDLSQVSYVVLDEADRMLDMGFERDIRSIFAKVQKKRQTLMFSATWPKSVQLLASEFLDNPIRVVVGSEDLAANSRVEQIVEVIDMDARDKRLFELLKSYHKQGEKMLIFVLYKKEATRIETLLTRRGFACTSIHGDKTSPARAQALEAFKKGNPPLMIATDVAARGLDIPKVEYVINYSFPLTVEDYVHRIGRTGRAGATGISHTFFHKHDKALSGELIGVLRTAKANIPEELLAFGTATKKKEPKLGKIDTNYVSNRITFEDSDSE
jgi:ATP-dependent RNA helicase DBP3